MEMTWDGLPVAQERPYASCVVVWREATAGREFLVLHRAHFGPDFAGDWAWTPPSGARQPGPDAAAARELPEETGLDLPLTQVESANPDAALYVAEAPSDAGVVLMPSTTRIAGCRSRPRLGSVCRRRSRTSSEPPRRSWTDGNGQWAASGGGSTIGCVLRRLRIENLVLIREAELELAPGLNAITGETGAGKTILAQALGLLLGAKGDASYVGAAGDEAYVEAELDLPDELEELAELRPEDEDALVVSRRVFADGRTRAYAWGRAAAREDVAAAVERVVAMSGQFEQRRLARPSYQLEVLDRFCGEDQLVRRATARTAWRDLQAARRRHDELTANAAFAEVRLGELRVLVEDTEGMESGDENRLRTERERHRHVADLAAGAAAAAAALAPDDGDGATGLVALAERSVAPLERLAPELQRVGDELRDVELRLREAASDLHAFLASLEAEPGRLEEIEAELDRIAEARRRFRCETYDELLARREEARAELAALEDGSDPAEVAARELAEAEARVHALTLELRAERNAAAPAFADAVAAELRGVGMGDGEFVCELRERDEAGSTGVDDAVFLVRPNAGLPFAPVAETASGGELSRIALAIAAVAGGDTLVFDEIDAGIGGETAHAVGGLLRRLAEHAQIVTITHVPQIAALADRHFRVEKTPGDPTHTRIEQLGDERRKAELERMLGGQEFLAAVRG
jgi:DNA repair protein RecN (Recombination protein N)